MSELQAKGGVSAAAAPCADWGVEELQAFYRAYHEHGARWEQVATAVGSGRGAGDCEQLHSLYQTFLGLPHSPQLEGAFSAMVMDVQRAAAAAATAAPQLNGRGHNAGGDSGSEAAAMHVDDPPSRCDGVGGVAKRGPGGAAGPPPRPGSGGGKLGASHSGSAPSTDARHQRAEGMQRPRQPPIKEAEEGGGGHGDGDGDGEMDEEGDLYYEEEEEEDEEGAASPSGADGTASEGRWQARGRKRRAGGGGGAAAASAGGGDGESLAAGRPKRARRSRKLFGESSSEDESQQRARQQRYRQRDRSSDWRPEGRRREPARQQGWDALNDDLGEGIDALLSLASIAHAAQSGEEQGEYDYEDDGSGGGGGYGKGGAARMARTPRKPTPGDLSHGSPTGAGSQANALRIISPAVAVRAPTPKKGGRAARTARAKRAAQAAAAARAARAARAAAEAEAREDYGDEGEEDLDGMDEDERGRHQPRYESAGEGAGDPYGSQQGPGAQIARAKARRTDKAADEGAAGDSIAAARAAAAAAAGVDSDGGGGGGRGGARRAKTAAAAYLHELAAQADEDGGEGAGPRGRQLFKYEEEDESAGTDDDRPRGGGGGARRAAARRGGRGLGPRLSSFMDGGGGRHSKRKSAPERLPQGAGELSKQASGDAAASLQRVASPAERALRHALGGAKVRRWAAAEWHYSSLDRPYFMASDMAAYLGALQVPPDVKLARPEWSVLRGALGRPRRLSLGFLRQERARLELYRESVRKAFVDAGGGSLPPEMPRPLRVGQPVVARHPVTRRLANGIILTMQPSRYRVQFNRSDLMTEVVRDTDVAAADPFESLPPALPVPPWSRFATPRPLPPNPAIPKLSLGPPIGAAAATGVPVVAPAPAVARRRGAPGGPWGAGGAAALPAVDEAQGRDDSELLEQIEGLLSRKDAALDRLRALNATAEAGAHLDGDSGRPSGEFQDLYACALADLEIVNAEITSAMIKLSPRRHLNGPVAPLRQAVAAQQQQQQQQAAAAAATAATGLGGTAPSVGPLAAVEAAVSEAAVRARQLVRAHSSQNATAPAPVAAGQEQQHQKQQQQRHADEAAIEELIASCVGVLIAAKLATAAGAGGAPDATPPLDGPAFLQQQQQQQQQQQSMPVGAVWAVLDSALQRLAPRAPGSAAAFANVRAAIESLKHQLAGFG